MKYALRFLPASLILLLMACHPRDTIAPVASWKQNSDIFLEDKILLGAYATDKRLVVVTTNGFFQMDVADTSFIQYNTSGGGNITVFGSVNDIFAPSLVPPILSNTLCVSAHFDMTVLSLGDIASTRDSTALVQARTYSQTYPSIYIPSQTGNPLARVNATPISRIHNNQFGAYNETTKTLLYNVFDNMNADYQRGHTLVVNQKETGRYFANTITSDPYRVDSVAAFKLRSCIAIKDYFLVTPDLPQLASNSFLYAIDAKNPLAPGGIKKIPVNISPPDDFFMYKGHLYSYGYNYGDVARSDDGGFTWRKLGQLSPYMKFSVVNGNLIGYAFAQVFWLDDGSETFTNIRELINTGLDFSLITGVAGFKNKVYTTTLSGLYVIDAQTFFTVKTK